MSSVWPGALVMRRGELDIAYVIAAEIDMHETRHLLGGVGVAVVLHTLNE